MLTFNILPLNISTGGAENKQPRVFFAAGRRTELQGAVPELLPSEEAGGESKSGPLGSPLPLAPSDTGSTSRALCDQSHRLDSNQAIF